MRGLFNYESPLMQALLKLADIVILNVLYLLFCLPIFTIGAAQAGLHTAFRVLLDPDDESSSVAAFLRGFKNGFSVITPVWLIMTLAVVASGFSCIMSYVIEKSGGFAVTILVVVVLILATILQTTVPIFHARFACSRRRLAKNTLFLMFAHPLRCFVSAVLMWAPIILFLCVDVATFLKLGIFFLTAWYGVAGLFVSTLMRKPFQILEAHFRETHDEDGNPVDPTQETTEEA